MIVLTSKDEPYAIKGWGMGYTVANPGLEEPRDLTGTDVFLDGQIVTVLGVETFTITRPYPKSLGFTVVIEERSWMEVE